MLLRSGIGPEADLRALGIDVAVDSPGVGANLHDQPFVLMSWEGSAEMEAAMAERAATGWAPDEQVMAKLASSFDPDCFDVHVLPYSPDPPLRRAQLPRRRRVPAAALARRGEAERRPTPRRCR